MIEKRFLTTKETAEYLDIPLHSLYVLCSNREITYYQCGKRSYFDLSDIHEYIMRHKVSANSTRDTWRDKTKKRRKEANNETRK